MAAKKDELANYSLDELIKQKAVQVLIEIHRREYDIIYQRLFDAGTLAIQWRRDSDKKEKR